eukprot:TRINITY_DN293_c0_g5_i1.p1 TRINITY_DN293_c0_g5~~TRINITY_DN293_c0_g5_i1.p1  ORF type:complete len:649 (+),score=157.47 TRINITY_DN293_c0_g5_i1:156-2102(+)
MLSNETSGILSAVLLTISRHEREIEVMRQLLAENETFEPYAVFKRLDTGRKGFVNAVDVFNFLRDYGVTTFSREDFQCFIQHYDRDNDETLVFGEFLQAILPQDHPILRTVATQRPNYIVEGKLSYEVEYTLTRLLEAEVSSFVALDEAKSKLVSKPDFTLQAAFDAIDFDRRGHVDFVNLERFLRQNGYNPFQEEIIAVLRRLDRDSDGQLSFGEFSLGIKPYGLISKLSQRSYFSLVLSQREERSPSKLEQHNDQGYKQYLSDVRSRSPPRPKTTSQVVKQKESSKVRSVPRKTSLSPSPIKGNQSERVTRRESRRSASMIKGSPEQTQKDVQDAGQRRLDISRAQYIQRIIKSAHKLQNEADVQLGRSSSPPKSHYGSIGKISSPSRTRVPESEDLVYSRYVDSINHPFRKPNVVTSKSEELGNYFRKIVAFEREVELARETLIARVDFSASDAFKCFDQNKNGFIGASKLEKTLFEIGLKPNRDELFLFIQRYDRDHDGRLKFSEFCDAILPHTTEGSYERRSVGSSRYRQIQGFNETFTQETQRLLVRLMNLLIENERQSESLRQAFQKEKILTSQEAFHLMDLNKDEVIDALELRQFLALHGIPVSESEVAALLEKFDTGRKGVISYRDFLQEFTPKSMRRL